MAGLGGNGPGSSHLSQEEAAHWQILQLVTTESNWCGFAVVHKFSSCFHSLEKSQNSPFGADFVSIWSPGDNSVPVRTYFTLAPSGKEMWLAVVESIQQNRERKEKLSERLSFCLRLCHVTSRISKLFIVQHNQHWRDSWQINTAQQYLPYAQLQAALEGATVIRILRLLFLCLTCNYASIPYQIHHCPAALLTSTLKLLSKD